MKLALSCAACAVVLCLKADLGAFQVEEDHSRRVIVELASHLPKGSIVSGKGLPFAIKKAAEELVSLSPKGQTVADLTERLILIRNVNRFLDYLGVVDKRQRDLIKRSSTAFTINERWPIYLNGESDLLTLAESRSSSAVSPVIYKLAAAIAHERIHAEGERHESKALAEEIRILDIFAVRTLVELDWLMARRTMLNEIMKGQRPDEPSPINIFKPPKI